MFGWIKSAIGFGVQLYKTIKGGTNTDMLTDVLPNVVAQLLPAVRNAIKYKGLDTKEKLDAWLKTIDNVTGIEATAIDLIPAMPAEMEEKFFDHAIELCRIYGYMQIGVEGYIVE